MLFGRAVNIFPLSYLLNFFRDHKITPKMMFIMWFSGESSLERTVEGRCLLQRRIPCRGCVWSAPLGNECAS